MYKHLYDNFSHWFHEGRGQVWFYSDPHFADEEMKYLRSDHIGAYGQVERINSKVGKYDTLVILGDVGDVEWVKKLHGYKVLIMGNHDAGATKYKRKYVTKLRCPKCFGNIVHYQPQYSTAWCVNCGWITPQEVIASDNHLFDEVYEGALTISDKIVLSHEPIEFPFALNIHGHDHSNWTVGPNHLNVCAEHINYMPISLKDIVKSGLLSDISTIHRDTIDKATARKGE